MELEEEVRCMINSGDMEMLTMLEMIDDIQRLGLGHRFEKDIKRKLDRISSSEQSYVEAEKSLRATALCFRLLRQHGYEISQGTLWKPCLKANFFNNVQGPYVFFHMFTRTMPRDLINHVVYVIYRYFSWLFRWSRQFHGLPSQRYRRNA